MSDPRCAIKKRPWGSGHVWCAVHKPTDMEIPVWRPYPGPDAFLPPIRVVNHRSREEAEQAALEIDWDALDLHMRRPEVKAEVARIKAKRQVDADYQHALKEARAGREPWPWESGGFLHREPVEELPTTLFELPEAA